MKVKTCLISVALGSILLFLSFAPQPTVAQPVGAVAVIEAIAKLLPVVPDIINIIRGHGAKPGKDVLNALRALHEELSKLADPLKKEVDALEAWSAISRDNFLLYGYLGRLKAITDYVSQNQAAVASDDRLAAALLQFAEQYKGNMRERFKDGFTKENLDRVRVYRVELGEAAQRIENTLEEIDTILPKPQRNRSAQDIAQALANLNPILFLSQDAPQQTFSRYVGIGAQIVDDYRFMHQRLQTPVPSAFNDGQSRRTGFMLGSEFIQGTTSQSEPSQSVFIRRAESYQQQVRRAHENFQKLALPTDLLRRRPVFHISGTGECPKAFGDTVTVRDANEWSGRWGGSWGGPVPEVDFERNMVVGVCRDVRSVDQRVSILGTVERNNRLLVQFSFEPVRPGAVKGQVVKRSWMLTVVPRSELKVSFEEATRR